ncbi:MAG TPA: DUF4261 domain-containing protein [Planctomycetota bacterium]
MSAGFANVYAVELLCETPPPLEAADILPCVRDRVGAAALVDPTATSGGLNLHFPQHRVPFQGESVPVQAVIGLLQHPVDARFLTAALDQSWDWPEARGAVADHRVSVVVSDLLASGLPYQERLDLFQNVLHGVLEIVPATAILWRPCGRLVDPTAYRRSRREGEHYDPLFAALNVRMFPAEPDGEVLMDTLGLSALGLPDLQCRFQGHDPNLVAGLLHGAGRYVYEKGDVLGEGHTVPAPGGEGHWTCRPGVASAPPARRVVEVLTN